MKFLAPYCYKLDLFYFDFDAGVATAFAARDILGNVLSGLSMQFSKPFSLGDTIKVYHTSVYFSYIS